MQLKFSSQECLKEEIFFWNSSSGIAEQSPGNKTKTKRSLLVARQKISELILRAMCTNHRSHLLNIASVKSIAAGEMKYGLVLETLELT